MDLVVIDTPRFVLWTLLVGPIGHQCLVVEIDKAFLAIDEM